jgi:poly(A) polymerase
MGNLQLGFKNLFEQVPSDLKERILNLKNVPQRLDKHPEGDVYSHTKIVVNRLVKYNDPVLSMAGLFHDIGKDITTKTNDKGIIQAIGHEDESAAIVIAYSTFLETWLGDTTKVNKTWNIVLNHMRIKLFEEMGASKKMQMADLPSFGRLILFREADDMSILTEKELNSING